MKKIYILLSLLIISISLFAQTDDWEYVRTDDKESTGDFVEYVHFCFSKSGIISIIIGLFLLLIAKNIQNKNSILRMGLGCFGVLCILPLILLILVIAQKLLGYAIIIAMIVGIYHIVKQDKY